MGKFKSRENFLNMDVAAGPVSDPFYSDREVLEHFDQSQIMPPGAMDRRNYRLPAMIKDGYVRETQPHQFELTLVGVSMLRKKRAGGCFYKGSWS
jgi:hypothetical protein